MDVVCLGLSTPPTTELADLCYSLTPSVACAKEALFLRGPLSLATLTAKLPPNQSIRIGFGSDAPRALAHARHGSQEISKLPLEALTLWADPFADKPPQDAAQFFLLLRELGLRSLSDLLTLPTSSLPLRFGKFAHDLMRRIRHGDPRPWPLYRPQELPRENAVIDPEHHLNTLEPVLFLLKTLLDRLFLKLHGRGLALSCLEMRLALDDRTTRGLRIQFPIPQVSSHGVLMIGRDRLDHEFRVRPITSSITELEITALELAPGLSAQVDFIDQTQRLIESWTSFVARTGDRHGAHALYALELTERYCPEHSVRHREALLGAKQAHAPKLPIPERPLRLLPSPEQLTRKGSLLIAADRRWTIMDWEGPEILSGEWWLAAFERHYYRVRCIQDKDLWIYMTPGARELYLHGVFD